MNETKFYNLLKTEGCTAPEKAMPYAVAIRKLGLRDRRDLYAIINTERESVVILPDNHGGYFAPQGNTAEERAEMVKFYRRMKKMGLSTMKAVKSVKEALGNAQGQSEMNL